MRMLLYCESAVLPLTSTPHHVPNIFSGLFNFLLKSLQAHYMNYDCRSFIARAQLFLSRKARFLECIFTTFFQSVFRALGTQTFHLNIHSSNPDLAFPHFRFKINILLELPVCVHF